MTNPARHALTPEMVAELRRRRSVAVAWAESGRVFRPEDADYYNLANEHLPAILDQLAAQLALLEEAERVCADTASQHTSWEREDTDEEGGDIEGAYDIVIKAARAFLAKLRANQNGGDPHKPLGRPHPNDKSPPALATVPERAFPDDLEQDAAAHEDTHQDYARSVGGYSKETY